MYLIVKADTTYRDIWEMYSFVKDHNKQIRKKFNKEYKLLLEYFTVLNVFSGEVTYYTLLVFLVYCIDKNVHIREKEAFINRSFFTDEDRRLATIEIAKYCFLSSRESNLTNLLVNNLYIGLFKIFKKQVERENAKKTKKD